MYIYIYTYVVYYVAKRCNICSRMSAHILCCISFKRFLCLVYTYMFCERGAREFAL